MLYFDKQKWSYFIYIIYKRHVISVSSWWRVYIYPLSVYCVWWNFAPITQVHSN